MGQGIITKEDLTAAVVERILGDVYTTTDPAAPTTGLKAFTRSRTGRLSLGVMSPDGIATELQPHFSFDRITVIESTWNSTGFSNIGGFNPTLVGTVQAVSLSTTNIFTQTRRVQAFTTAATSGQAAGYRGANPMCWRGNAAGLGGFYFAIKFGWSAKAAGNTDLMFVGLNTLASAFSGTQVPSTVIDQIGVCKESGDTNFHTIRVNGAGTFTKVDTGIAFEVNKIYILRIYCLPNASSMFISLETCNTVLTTGTFYEAEVSTNLPTNTALLRFHVVGQNNDVTSTVNTAFCNLYLGTNY